jgi:hypothetical protein
MALKRSLIASFAILACLMFAWATGAGRPYPASAGGVIDPTCVSSLPCIEYDNNGTGPGIRGISVAGNGLAGSTKNHSTSTANGRAGLIGNDIGTGSFNSGVHGLSVSGTGVSGLSTSGVGVSGTTSNGFGVEGVSSNSVGVLGVSNTSDAVRGVVGSGVASSFHAGVAGLDRSTSGATNQGVYGDTTLGIGVQGVSLGSGTAISGSAPTGIGLNVFGGYLDSTGTGFPALSIVGNFAGAFDDLIDGCPAATVNPCDIGHSVFRVSGNGYVDIAGEYRKNGFCVAGCSVATSTSIGRAVVTYAPMVAQPTIEDFGEARLVNGQTYVHLDSKFGNVVEQRANYLVFITPEGDANTLYVTQKSMGGFTVRESHGGRSTLMFSYRIVAKPFGSREARLPMVELPNSGSPKQRPWHPGGVAPVR